MRSALLVILIIVLFSCDPCTDCGPETNPPTIEASLFDIDRLTEVQDSLMLLDTLQKYTDSLLIVVDSIENRGGSLFAEKMALEDFLDGLTDLRANKTDSVFSEALDSVESLLNKNETNLENGRTAVAEFRIDQTGYSISYDSARSQYLPLVLNDDQTIMNLVVDDEELELNISYTLSDELDEDKRVVRYAFIESLTSLNMDSVFCVCNEIDTVSCSSFDCDSENSSISCYF